MKYHVLIVDDVPSNIQVAMNILRENDYEFSFATGGTDGLALVQKNPEKFDLILLDIMMPDFNGYEVCAELKKRDDVQDIPVIFLTARMDIDSISKGFSVGAVDYITKPFHPVELLSRVKNHLELQFSRKLLKQNNLALESKIQFTKKRLLTELEENQREMIYLLTELMESTSDETGRHIQRVSQIAALLARYHPALSEEDESLLLNAAPMHDVGKLTVPMDLLKKPGRLSTDEFEIIKAHTENAFRLLNSSPRKLMKTAAIIAHEHHERWDGSGYPRNLKETDIHIYGRIVAVADVFDSLTHTRCYKRAWPVQKAFQYITDHSASHFDPEVVEIFVKHFDELCKLCNFSNQTDVSFLAEATNNKINTHNG